ncbi:MAG: histidine kinase, partial [Bacteroidota bacterium]
YLVNKKQSLKADYYLKQFAQLLRGVLEHAPNSFVSLLKEIQLVQNYLEIEQLQFGDKFEFSIDLDESLMLDGYKIPPMLLQPQIENAIIHGISSRGYGKICLAVKDAGAYIKFSIEDDGIGRDEARKQREKKGSPISKTQVGIKNTQERIAVLNRLHLLDIRMDIEDLFKGEEAKGTRVVFHFLKMKGE